MELRSTGNPDINNPVTMSVLEYLAKKGREAMGKTKGDAMRSGNDMYISVQIAGCIVSYLIQNGILRGTEADHKDLISGISDDIEVWLKQPVEE